MKHIFTVYFYTLLLALGLHYPVFSQEATVQLGETEIGVNEVFTITATVSNTQLKECSGFPEIQGMTKVGTSSSTNTAIVNGRMSSSQSLIQNYRATKQGTYQLPAFTMKINGQSVSVQGTTIKVLQQTARQNYDPFADFFGMFKEEPTSEFLDVKEDAFFAVTVNKPSVYVGEGFNMSVAMYIADANRAFLEFHEIGEQLGEILKKIKPSNCWEENFGIEEIVPEVVTIGRKTYRQYRIYQANFYPITEGQITVPATEFSMIKFKVSANPQFFGNNTVKDFVKFKSKEKIITVKALPEHPLKGGVAVGNFKLNEEISSEKLQTGQNFNYKFQIVGEGNISGIKPPDVQDNPNFDFYPPNEKIQINRSNDNVFGSKQFNYMAVPTESGNYRLGEFFQWIYFNTQKGTYDTLKSRLTVNVIGESKAHALLDSSQTDFYDLIGEADNTLTIRGEHSTLRLIATIFLLGVLGFLGYLIYRQSRQSNFLLANNQKFIGFLRKKDKNKMNNRQKIN